VVDRSGTSRPFSLGILRSGTAAVVVTFGAVLLILGLANRDVAFGLGGSGLLAAAIGLALHAHSRRVSLWERAPSASRTVVRRISTRSVSELDAGDRSLFLRIVKQVGSRWPHLTALFALDLMLTPLLLLTPVPLKIAIDSVIGPKPIPNFLDTLLPQWATSSSIRILAVAAILQVVIVLLIQLQMLASTVLRMYTGEKLTLGFRSKLFRHAQRLSLSFHDRRGTADSIYRIQYDTPSINYVMIDGIIPMVASAITVVSAIYVTFLLDWQLALVAIAACPPLIVFSHRYRGEMRPRYKAVKGLESSALTVVQEVLTSVRVVKAFGREDREHERFVRHLGETVRERVQLAYAEGSFGVVVNLVTAIGTAFVLVIGVRSVQSGALSLGELTIVIAYLSQLYSPLKTVGKTFASMQSSLVSAQRAFELMDQSPEVVELPDARPLARPRGEIEFRNVSFAYEDNEFVLDSVSFHVPAGTRLGIAGRTGAGKTTLMSLLMRFYDPTRGRVLIDGEDIREFKLVDLRNQFSIFLQDPVLFSTTIGENILYARPDASFDDVVAAAKAADIHDSIACLPNGYDTIVGERGMRLSGGERQRVALARAFLRNAPILILDEPTSSVDMKTEAAIMESMQRLMEGRTTLMIAHRTSTLEYCDAFLSLEKGRVVGVAGSETISGAHESRATSARNV
jgi:ATP-binding cassette, subfamily B, bacterial